jgi:hypothetical protein
MIEEITKGSTEKLPIGSPTSTQNLPLPMAMDISNFLIEQFGLMVIQEKNSNHLRKLFEQFRHCPKQSKKFGQMA